jgi:tyrosinase
MRIRKNQKDVKASEWAAFIDAVNKTHGVGAKAPAYRDFVGVHARAMNMGDPVGMSWGVHSMGQMMPGRNFLAWHRRFVIQMENRLRKVDPTIIIPYWNAIEDRAVPAPLDRAELLQSWSITRHWKPAILASQADLDAANAMGTFLAFQSTLEGAVHASVHNAVGGTMASASSPADPLFFLHHANIDRIWSEWQVTHPTQNPPNATETLEPRPLFGVSGSKVLSIAKLGYRYV